MTSPPGPSDNSDSSPSLGREVPRQKGLDSSSDPESAQSMENISPNSGSGDPDSPRDSEYQGNDYSPQSTQSPSIEPETLDDFSTYHDDSNHDLNDHTDDDSSSDSSLKAPDSEADSAETPTDSKGHQTKPAEGASTPSDDKIEADPESDYEPPQYFFQAPTPVLEPNLSADNDRESRPAADPAASTPGSENTADNQSPTNTTEASVDSPMPQNAENPDMAPASGHSDRHQTNGQAATGQTAQGAASVDPSPQANPPESTPQQANQPDEQMIQQTKIQIRSLVNEIQRLAQSDCSVEDFYEGFLTRVTSALASVGGAIWKVHETGRLELQYQINVGATELADNEQAQISHDLLLRKIIRNNEPMLIPPLTGSGSDDASNPTSCLLVVERLMIDQQVVGLVEVFQRSGSGPTTQRGYLRFLVQMCEIASDFLKNKKIRNYQQQQELWEKLEQFIRASHFGLDPKQTAYTIVNEARRLVDCDRVSFARPEGGRLRIQVVSGLDSIDRRADEIKKLGELATAVVRGEKPLWFNGNTEELPPQIEQRIHDYVDRSHSKVVCVIPLWETVKEDIVEEAESPTEKRPKKNVLGALIFERLGDSRIDNTFRKRIDVVAGHASDALTNATQHHDVFLMPLWQAIGRTRIFSRAATPRWIIVLSILAVLTGILSFLPWNFELSADGKLTPKNRYEIFAPLDGEVKWVIEGEPGKPLRVEKDQVVAELENDDVQRELIELQNNITLELEKISEAEDQLRTQGPDLTPVQELRLEQEIATSYARIEGYRQEVEIARKKMAGLKVPAKGNGLIVDWQLNEKLKNRQVSRGQKLMTIVDDSKDWVVEVELLEKKFGHLVEARKALEEGNLKVTFVLVSLPNRKYEGRVISIDQKADVVGEKGNTILLRIAFDKNEIDPELLLYGTKVTARIYCGRRSLGYVLFREVYETLQRNVFFWF